MFYSLIYPGLPRSLARANEKQYSDCLPGSPVSRYGHDFTSVIARLESFDAVTCEAFAECSGELFRLLPFRLKLARTTAQPERVASYRERLAALGLPDSGWTSLVLRRGMQHPLRSASATPDSATGWEAVDREIEQLAQQGRMDESKAAKLAEGADVEDGREEAPPLPGEGGHDAADDTEALHAEAEQYIRRLDPEEQTRKVILLACACCLSIGRCVPSFCTALAFIFSSRREFPKSLCNV